MKSWLKTSGPAAGVLFGIFWGVLLRIPEEGIGKAMAAWISAAGSVATAAGVIYAITQGRDTRKESLADRRESANQQNIAGAKRQLDMAMFKPTALKIALDRARSRGIQELDLTYIIGGLLIERANAPNGAAVTRHNAYLQAVDIIKIADNSDGSLLSKW